MYSDGQTHQTFQSGPTLLTSTNNDDTEPKERSTAIKKVETQGLFFPAEGLSMDAVSREHGGGGMCFCFGEEAKVAGDERNWGFIADHLVPKL